MAGPGGSIGHAELQIGDSRLMLSDEFPGMNSAPPADAPSSSYLFVYDANVDALFDRAVKAGCKVRCPSPTSSGATATAKSAILSATSGASASTSRMCLPRK